MLILKLKEEPGAKPGEMAAGGAAPHPAHGHQRRCRTGPSLPGSELQVPVSQGSECRMRQPAVLPCRALGSELTGKKVQQGKCLHIVCAYFLQTS